MASPLPEQPQSGSLPSAQQPGASADNAALKKQLQSPADSSSEPQENSPLIRWIFKAGMYLIIITAIILVKCIITNSLSAISAIIIALLGVLGILCAFIQTLLAAVPNKSLFQPPVWLASIYGKSRLMKFIDVGIHLIGITGILVASFSHYPTLPPNIALIPRLTPTLAPCIGKPTSGSAPFSVYPNYNLQVT